MRHKETSITVSQEILINNLNVLSSLCLTKEQFVTERSIVTYISAACRLDCSYAFAKVSQAIEPDENDVE